MRPAVTLTTACYDLSLYNSHPTNHRSSILTKTASIMQLPAYLVCFTDQACVDDLYRMRKRAGLIEQTQFVIRNFEEIPMAKYLPQVIKNRLVYHPTADLRTGPQTHILMLNKFDFQIEVIANNPFNTEHFGWIDAKIERDDYSSNFSKISQNGSNLKVLRCLHVTESTDAFHLTLINSQRPCYTRLENKKHLYRSYPWLCAGCFYTYSRRCLPILESCRQVAIDTTMAGYGHGEEGCFLESISQAPLQPFHFKFADYGQILDNFEGVTQNVGYVIDIILMGMIRQPVENGWSWIPIAKMLVSQLQERVAEYHLQLSASEQLRLQQCTQFLNNF